MSLRPGQAKGPSTSLGGSGGGGTSPVIGTLGAFPQWFKVQITHTQLQAAALTNNIELYSLPLGGVIHAVHLKQSTAFAGTSITAYNVSVGLTSFAERYASLYNVFAAVAATTKQISNVVDSPDNGSATSIKLFAVSVGANLNASTAGVLEVGLLLSLCTLP